MKIVMKSWGGTKRDFMGGLTEREAVEICEGYGWHFADGYDWDLDIEEE